MRVRIQHSTDYGFGAPSAFGPHLVRLRPAGHTRTHVLSYNLEVEPKGEERWQFDPWGNRIVRITWPGDDYKRLRFTVDAVFDIQPINPFNFFIDSRCEHLPFAYPDGLQLELRPFLQHEAVSPRLREFVESVPFEGKTVDYLVALNQHVAATVRYIIRNEAGIQTSEETLTCLSGSCRDSAMLLCDALRARGLASRFASGYLVQLTDEGNLPDEARGVLQDVVDLHAWAEVYVPGAGWIGLDGTSGLLCGEGHIPLACTVNPELAAPISGSTSQAADDFAFSMTVERLGHEPRPLKPYDDADWAHIVRAGDHVDELLHGQGIMLTCGGEPTWTSRLHPTLPEWNTEALGPTKLSQGLKLARELSDRLGVGTLSMMRMGKQYPGESLPRWNCQLLWRHDEVPIWRNTDCLNRFGEAEASAATLAQAQSFAEAVIARLGIATQPIEGFEDPWHYAIEEQNLPVDVDPLSFGLDDPEDRRRLTRVLQQGLANAVGVAFPLQMKEGQWVTSEWSFRRGRMYLIPGDSPMGLRLPLNSLAGVAPEFIVADASDVQRALRTGNSADDQRASGLQGVQEQSTKPARSAGQLSSNEILRSALCFEPRDGVLHVFLPPLPDADAFLALVDVIEACAEATGIKVALEGYPPPHDPRIASCLVTPDPGVIEVNLPVASSFAEYLASMEIISEAALHSGLTTEKYQLDGRATGSGGGNHLTLGGARVSESPFLMRPRLLGDLLRYTQHHPALSYLFSGLFVGPTSQAPRIDESRLNSLEELEMALSQIPADGDYVAPWTIDRLLRNLVIDVAGNTHRTEICLDKLYSPEGPAGRQGLVEFRAFEMPPNERMAAVQMLLVRAMVARFSLEGYERPLVPWDTRLHDQFMLPHFLWRDMEDIVRDMQRVGVPLESEWFRPFIDYRFPKFGTLQLEDMQVEIRSALEPWPTLGEQTSGSGTARMVDSSLERIQVKARGLIEGRHVLAVNGIELPMHPTGTVGEQVAGIKFRAWQVPVCLQPNIPVHHPLRIDVIDTWGKRSLGACSYHVIHPDGQGFNEPPLTAFEAAARRAQRFSTEGHMPWPVKLQKARVHPDHPVTLDMRWQHLPLRGTHLADNDVIV